MKRSVAILGPTPGFVRWAIWHPCELRPLDQNRFADRTFRNLRSIREMAVAQADERCFEGVCMHPSAADVSTEDVRGFSVEEVTDTFGGESAIQAACQGCPANVRQISALVGCYGFLPTNQFSFDRLLSGYPQGHIEGKESNDDSQQDSNVGFDLVQSVQQSAEAAGLLPALRKQFLLGHETTGPIWYSLWKNRRAGSIHETILDQDRLLLLEVLFAKIISQSVPESLIHFYHAMERCIASELSIVAEYVPSGYSDGRTWRLAPSCPDCHFDVGVEEGVSEELNQDPGPAYGCPACGSRSPMVDGPKFKVLGTRPYVHLVSIVGEDGTARLADRMRDRK